MHRIKHNDKAIIIRAYKVMINTVNARNRKVAIIKIAEMECHRLKAFLIEVSCEVHLGADLVRRNFLARYGSSRYMY